MPAHRLTPKGHEKGAALILLTLMLLFVVLPMVGLAVDASIGYLLRTRLSAAVDAAALAGARSLSVGLDLSSQQANAKSTVTNYLKANFPDGYFGTSGLTWTSDIAETAYKVRTVSVNASASYPLGITRILGHSTAEIAVSGQATRRDVNVILVLDRSGSMAGSPCSSMKAAAQSFADKFVNGRDRLGLITFKASAHVDYPPTLNFKSGSTPIDGVIGQIQCSGSTGSAQALWEGYQQLQAVNEPGALNLMVFFTDGLPNGIAADWQLKQSDDTRYSSIYTSSLVATPKTACQDNPTHSLTGVIAQSGNGPPTGYTSGLMDPSGTSISSTNDPLISAPGCSFTKKGSAYVREDIASFHSYFLTPPQSPTDINGNAIDTNYKFVPTYPSGPYQGMMRVDSPEAIVAESANAADSAARRIRNDTDLSPVIYSIGFASDVDPVFLRRVANDPASTAYDSTRPAGLYVYAPNSNELSAAFNRVASEILRLAK